jgi:hypothetical protein
MENIIEPNESFDFSKLSLGSPTSTNGTNFTRIQYNARPLYIQTTKSLTRQGFVKSGKKYYCDLMFDKNSENLITWFENLEETCQKLIFAKSETWFKIPLELSDIETAFTPTIRVYKSGKYYLVRANVKNNSSGDPSLKIYNEDETSLSIHDVTNETEVLCILEIQGIKFTSRNFQIEIEIKQAMVIHEEPIFDSCLIKTNKRSAKVAAATAASAVASDVDDALSSSNLGKIILQTKEDKLAPDPSETTSNSVLKEEESKKVEELEEEKEVEEKQENTEDEDREEDEEEDDDDDDEYDDDDVDYKDPITIEEGAEVNKDELDFMSLDEEEEKPAEDENELKEANVDLSEDLDETNVVKLKKPNEVYFEMYKKAREKAKQAKKAAILAYLDAKNIKKTYMLDNLDDENDSDGDFDEEDLKAVEIEEEK